MKNGNTVNYTAPQKVRMNNVDKFMKMVFRVNNVYRDMGVCVMSGDRRLTRFKREYMTPSEVEKIVIPKILLERTGDEAIVHMEGAGA